MILKRGLGLIGFLALSACGGDEGEYSPVDMDQFAQCLTDNGAVMYGAKWCGVCTAQKAVFGKSFQYINYVDCDEEGDVCQEEGIRGYPTWKKGDMHYVGGIALKVLGRIYECEAPEIDEEALYESIGFEEGAYCEAKDLE